MITRLRILSILTVLGTMGVLNAYAATAIVDQSQPSFTQTGDLASSGNSGQSFTAGISGSLTAVRLIVEGKGFSGTDIFGSDIVLSLWSTAPAGTPTRSLLASGTFSRSSLVRDVPQWITISFDRPYQQSFGEVLAFTIYETAGGGADGFNEYGAAVTDPYAGGQMFFGFTAGQPLVSSSRDLAFETVVVVPEPTSLLLLGVGGVSLMFSRPRAQRCVT